MGPPLFFVQVQSLHFKGKQWLYHSNLPLS